MSSTRSINEGLEILLKSNYLDDLSVIQLSMTNTSMQEIVSQLLTDNMLSSGLLKSDLLASVFLFPYLEPGKHYDEKLLQLTLTYLGFLTKKAIFDLEIVERLVDAIVKSGYKNKVHFYSVFSNNCFFGNRDVLELFTDKGIKVSLHLDQKVRTTITEAIEKKKFDVANNLLKTYAFFIEKKIELNFQDILEKIKSHKVILNGGGDSSIKEIGHPISKQAAKVYKIIKNTLDSGDCLLEEYKGVSELIFMKLSQSKSAKLISYGARDASTTSLYTKIMSIMVQGNLMVNDFFALQDNVNVLSVSAHNQAGKK